MISLDCFSKTPCSFVLASRTRARLVLQKNMYAALESIEMENGEGKTIYRNEPMCMQSVLNGVGH